MHPLFSKLIDECVNNYDIGYTYDTSSDLENISDFPESIQNVLWDIIREKVTKSTYQELYEKYLEWHCMHNPNQKGVIDYGFGLLILASVDVIKKYY